MSVSNLTNTKWIIRSDASNAISGNASYSISFSSNSNNYVSLSTSKSGSVPTDAWNITYDNVMVYDGTFGWDNQAYRIIEITGGTDVANATLIAWLEANATQVPVTDLTDTKWVINDSLLNMNGYYFYVNFVSNNTNYSDLQIADIGANNSVYYGGTRVYKGNGNLGETGWINQAYRVIEFINGTDISNPDLISWLTENATQVSVTDLTGTKWVINAEPVLSPLSNPITFSINFISNNTNYIYLGVNEIPRSPLDPIANSVEINYDTGTGNEYNYDTVYTETMGKSSTKTWASQAYRLISITDGTDATNPDLIVWLTKNATQVPVTDLINTTWIVKKPSELPNQGGSTVSYSINNVLSCGTYTSTSTDTLTFAYGGLLIVPMPVDYPRVIIYVSNQEVLYQQDDSTSNSLGDVETKLKITNGTDVSNPNLIIWLTNNATLQTLSNDYTLTHSLTNLAHGNITLQITPDSGYTYPSSISVANGTLVSYDNSTGIAVISGDDTTSVSCECPVATSGYTLTIISGVYNVEIWYANGTHTTNNNDGTYTGVEAFMVGDGWLSCDLNTGSIEYNGTTLTGHAYFSRDIKYTLLTDCEIQNVMN